MGKTSVEGSSGGKPGESSLAAPLLAAGAVPAAAATSSQTDAAAAANTGGAAAAQSPSSGGVRPTPQQRHEHTEGRRSHSSTSSTRAGSAASPLESSLMLLPLSLTPAIAVEPHVQSVDLFANVKAYDHGQGCCNYLCSRCAPVFDWVSYLHAEAVQRPVLPGSLSNGGTAGGEGRGLQPQPQRQERGALFVDVGQAPAGAQATLLTLFGNRQLVFRAVQEVNRAYSNFWRLLLLVLLLLVLFLPGVGLLALLLIGCSSSLRKMCDDAVLQQMRAACEKADQRLAAWGVGLLLMEGYPAVPLMPTARQDLEMGLSLAAAAGPSGAQARTIGPALASPAVSDAHAAAALAAVAAAPPHSSRVWVLRVYMLPRRDDAAPTGAAAAVVAPAAHSPQAASRHPSPSTTSPASSPVRASSNNSSGAPPPLPLAPAAPSRTSPGQRAAEAPAENGCTQAKGSAGAAAELVSQQQRQPETSLTRPLQAAGVLPEDGALSVNGVAAAVEEVVTQNEKVSAGVANVEPPAVATPGSEIAAEDRELLQARVSTCTPVQREAEFKKKRRGRKSETKSNDMREPLLRQEHNADTA